MKKVAVLQSNYIPWKGYFDIIGMVDEFILYDDMQYTRRDWRNRNQIKTPHGLHWLTIPVLAKGKYSQKINETEVESSAWAYKHFQTITAFYSKSPFWSTYKDWLKNLYERAEKETRLSKINELFLHEICQKLGISTKISLSSDYALADGKTERLVQLCKDARATRYISGPAAKDYVVPELFQAADIELVWMDYRGYPKYKQLHEPFEHNVSILDLLFNTGDDAPYYIWGWRN